MVRRMMLEKALGAYGRCKVVYARPLIAVARACGAVWYVECEVCGGAGSFELDERCSGMCLGSRLR